MLNLLFTGPDPYVDVLLLPAKNVHHVVTFSWEICYLYLCCCTLDDCFMLSILCLKDFVPEICNFITYLTNNKDFQINHEKLNLHKVV